MYLLDTSTVIWALADKNQLSTVAQAILSDTSLPLSVSIVSAWEVAIKVSIGKLNFFNGSEFFLDQLRINGIRILDINGSHLKQLENLPQHHRDPFDRLLIATAMVEGFTILSSDKNFKKYDVLSIW
jgi:PIN domain nuclease of toxin-antitoxin system